MTISAVENKAFDKIQYSFVIKKHFCELRMRWNFKSVHFKNAHNGGRLDHFPLRSGMR